MFKKNWKTTLFGGLAASAQILQIFGVPAELAQGVSSLALAIFAAVSQDAKKPGEL